MNSPDVSREKDIRIGLEDYLTPEGLKEYNECLSRTATPVNILTILAGVGTGLVDRGKKDMTLGARVFKIFMVSTFVRVFLFSMCKIGCLGEIQKSGIKTTRAIHYVNDENQDVKQDPPPSISPPSDPKESYDFSPSFSNDIDLSTPLNFSTDYTSRHDNIETNLPEQEEKQGVTYSDLMKQNRKQYSLSRYERPTQRLNRDTTESQSDTEPIRKRTNAYGDIIE